MHVLRSLPVRVVKKAILRAMPARWRLPLKYGCHLLGPCERELRHLDRICRGRDVAVDVGANVGFYSYRMSKLFGKVYAFEINDELTGDLAACSRRNIEVVHKGLSSREGDAVLHIPVVAGTPLTGWASLAPGNHPAAREHVEKRVAVCTLDQFNLQRVSFIKIDVEGHEVEVLKGAARTLARWRPVVLIEISARNMAEVDSMLGALDYRKHKLQDLTGKPGSEQNFIFMPKEKETAASPAPSRTQPAAP